MSDYSLEKFLDNKHYLKYKKQKQKIIDKHPKIKTNPYKTGPQIIYNWTDDERKEWRSYIKQIADLLLKPNGNYQKFIWDIEPDSTKNRREFLLKKKKSTNINR
jgi:hypothetical protein